MRIRPFAGTGSVLLSALFALVLAAGGNAEEAERPTEAAAPSVGLDALLRLPSGPIPSAGQGVQAPERARWEERFSQVRAELSDARARLASSQKELEEIARNSETWQMAAPGAQHDPETSPISFKLRADIRRHREDIARAERRLRELEVEASLAGIPAEWRRPDHEDAAPDS